MYDRLSPGEMTDYHDFRNSNFGYLYFCPHCVRSFDAEHTHSECKFCGGPINTLKKPTKPAHKGKHNVFRYYCPKCQKTNFSEEERDSCQLCGGKIIHSYSWKNAGIRERMRTRFMKIRKTIFHSRPKKKFMSIIRKPVDFEKIQ